VSAEALKLRVLGGQGAAETAPAAAETVRLAATRFVGRLQLELMRSTARAGPEGAAAQPAVIYLAGGGARLPELPALLAGKLKARVERYDPLRRVDVAVAVRLGGAGDQLAPELLGAAVGPRSGAPLAFSLLPPAEARLQDFRKRQPFLLASAALAVAALALVAWHYHRLVTATYEDLAGLEQRLVPLRALVERNVGNLAHLESARARIAGLRGTVEMKSSWIDFLGDLQARLEEIEDVWLEKLQIVPGPAAGGPLRLALSGRLLDWDNPISKVSPDSFQRVKQLFRSFSQSEFVAAVEGERFDNVQPGILRFDCTLVINPQKPL